MAFGQSSAIVVGPPQVLEPISPTNVTTVPAASGELREARRALLPDSAGPTSIDTSTRSDHDGDRGNRFAVLSGLSGEPEQIVEPRVEISGPDTESDRPHTWRRRRFCVVWNENVSQATGDGIPPDSHDARLRRVREGVQRERLFQRHRAVHVAAESIRLLATRVDPTSVGEIPKGDTLSPMVCIECAIVVGSG